MISHPLTDKNNFQKKTNFSLVNLFLFCPSLHRLGFYLLLSEPYQLGYIYQLLPSMIKLSFIVHSLQRGFCEDFYSLVGTSTSHRLEPQTTTITQHFCTFFSDIFSLYNFTDSWQSGVRATFCKQKNLYRYILYIGVSFFASSMYQCLLRKSIYK